VQEIKIKLFEEAYAHKPKVQQWILSAALSSIVLHFVFMLYLLLKGGFHTFFIVVYLLSSVVIVVMLVSYWFEHRLHKRKHLTLTGQGVSYRPGFLEKEQEFDWNEIDTVLMRSPEITFILKNGEHHSVSLAVIREKGNLQQAEDQIRNLARLNDVEVA
jgi:purine-cytosine permease-like protein